MSDAAGGRGRRAQCGFHVDGCDGAVVIGEEVKVSRAGRPNTGGLVSQCGLQESVSPVELQHRWLSTLPFPSEATATLAELLRRRLVTVGWSAFLDLSGFD
jgi:hypothetical protein